MSASSLLRTQIILANRMIPAVPPIAVSRPLLFGLTAAGAIAAVATPQPTSSFAAGFAVGAGSVFVLSFLKTGRFPLSRSGEEPGDEGRGEP
jgi:hypothetical protein